MTKEANTAAETATETNEATGTNEATRTEWPRRFGTMTEMHVKSGRNGKYALVTIDCKAFTQKGIVFNETAIEKLSAAGIGARVWAKGPIEAVARKNGIVEDTFKIVYAGEMTPKDGDEAPQSAAEEQADDLTALKGVGVKVADALAEAGIKTYAALASASAEVLDAAGSGFAARAARDDWAGQADAMIETVDTRENDEVPF